MIFSIGGKRRLGLAVAAGKVESVVDRALELVPAALLHGLKSNDFGSLALDCIADRADQEFRLSMSFDKVVLRAMLHSLEGKGLIADAAEHDDGDCRIGGLHLAEG